MANVLGPYDPIFYAQEALKIMMSMYGMINRVNHSFDKERKTFNKGEVANIKRPSTIITQAGGTGTIADLNVETIPITLNNWRESKFAVNDEEYAFTGEELIRDHIAPAAHALGEYVNTQLVLLAKDIPWFSPWTSTIVASDVTSGMKVLKDAGSGIAKDTQNIHMGIDTTVDAALQGLSEFNAANIAGNTNIALVDGQNPGRFGVGDFFVDQTFSSFTSGTIVSAATDLLGALAADADPLDATINVANFDGVETFAKGDTLIIAGSEQRHAVTATATMSGGANAAVAISPPIQGTTIASGAVVTAETKATAFADAYEPNLLFHRDAFALVFGGLPDGAALAGLGVQIATVQDPVSGMAVRARRAYIDSSAKVAITLDVLFGGKTINPNYAVVMRRNS